MIPREYAVHYTLGVTGLSASPSSMGIGDILLATIAALAAAILFFRWGLGLFRPRTRSRSFLLIFLVVHAVPAAIVAYSYWLLTSSPESEGIAPLLRGVWVACGFTGGALLGLVLSAVRRLMARTE